MKTPMITIFLLAAVLCGCSGLPSQYSSSSKRSLVRGVSAGGTSIQIQSIDGNDVARDTWFSPGYYGDKVWLEPGVHKLTIVCSTEGGQGELYAINTDVEVEIQSGYSYYLTTTPFKGVGTPQVMVTKKQNESSTRYLP